MAIHVEDAAMHSPIQLQVEATPDRLDRYLADHLPELTRSRIQKLIEQEQVQVNGVICASKKASLRIGDRISLTIPETIPLDIQAEDIPLDILYEDDHLIILNKPVGLVVHPAPGHEDGTLVNALLAHCGDNLAGIGGVQRPGIVHRLDKDTSGAIAIAKTDQAHQHLQAQFKTKTARREYLGIVYGAPQPSGTIDAPIGRKEGDRKRMAIVPEDRGGRKAITHWQVEERLENYSLVRFQLETGRTHQIRVHSAHIGHPVVGDPVYSLGKSVGVNLPGQALHAWKLTLQHPVTEAWIEAIAPIPPVFTKLLDVLRNRAAN
jgi:23S rRNA pseudouridine1911/1915/1917 synthase